MLILGSLVRFQTYFLGLFASVVAPVGDGPPDLSDQPDAQEAPDDLYIESITASGTGCPNPSSVASVISDDHKSFLLIFDNMQLSNPGGSLVKNISCTAGVKLHIPGGYQVALATVNTRGYAFLDEKIKARQTSKYFFAGNPIAWAPHSEMVGPFDDLYDFSDFVPFESYVWSPCGGSAIFAIQTSLNLNAKDNPGGEAIFSNDTLDGKFQQLYLWQFKKC